MQRDRTCRIICIWLLSLGLLFMGSTIKVQAAGRTVIKVDGMNIKQTTSLKRIEKKFGKAKIVTESMYGGKAYSFYKGDYKSYLYLESNTDGKWIGAGSVGTKFATKSYKSGKRCDSVVRMGTDIYDDDYAVEDTSKAGMIYGAVEYLDNAGYSKAKKRYCKNIACRIGMAQHATAIRNAVWSYRGQNQRLEFDEEGFIVADQIIRKSGSSVYDYTEEAGKGNYVDMHGCGRIMLAHMDPFHLADEGKEYNVDEEYPYSLMIYYYTRGNYCYEDSCYGIEFVDEFINDKCVTKSPNDVLNAIVETTRLDNKKATSITLKVGKSEQLTIPKTKKKIKWSSSNKKVVKVNKKGKITALRKGSAIVKARKGNKKYVCKVKVTKKNSTNAQFAKTVALKTGESVTLKISGAQKGTGWSIADKKIAKITAHTGASVTIYGLSSGTTKLRVKVGSTTKECVVTVEEKYSYQLIPLLAPFNNYFYLKTEDPDPYDLEILDTDSPYLSSGLEADIITPVQETYQDVQYVDKNYYRVNGGYICQSHGYTNGGTLKIRRRLLKNHSGQYMPYEFNKNNDIYESTEAVDTVIQINCGKVTTRMQYLLDTYTDPNKGLFDNLDALQKGLDTISVYPQTIMDKNKVNPRTPYVSFASSSYPELNLNIHADIYEYSTERCLSMELYPYVLDSLSFPSTMWLLAKKLDPTCSVSRGYAHWEIIVSANGTQKVYGGDGQGGPGSVLSSRIAPNFTFSGNIEDYGTHASMNVLFDQLISYHKYQYIDLQNEYALLSSPILDEKIGTGQWCRIAIETSNAAGYAYMTKQPMTNIQEVSNTWVDGRYIGQYEIWEKGATFAQYPAASILLRNQTYTTKSGVTKTGDLKYDYDSVTDTWRAAFNYADGAYQLGDKLPEQFILTRGQVENMCVDANTNSEIEHGLIYDGTQYPGTAY